MEKTHTHIHIQFNSTLYSEKIKSSVLSLHVQIQINLRLGILGATEADTALSTSVGGEAEGKTVNMSLSQTLGFENHAVKTAPLFY